MIVDNADDRNDLRDVARRADHRTRCRKRYFAAYLRGYRYRACRAASCRSRNASGAGDPMQTLGVVFLVVVMIALIALIVYVESARRNIAISYASRRVGNQTFRGQETSLPLKINMGGVIPVIFASSVLAMPQTLFSAFPPDPNEPEFDLGEGLRIFPAVSRRRSVLRTGLSFADRYLHVLLHHDHFQHGRSGGQSYESTADLSPGIRPGAPTADYLNSILTRLTTVGALYLAFVAFVPQLLLSGFKVARLPFIGTSVDNFLTRDAGLKLDPDRFGISVLLRRHIAADPGRRGDGYGRADRGPARDEKLRGIS